MGKKDLKEETRTIHSGCDLSDYKGIVNPPPIKASTILYPDLDAYENPNHKYRYGRNGTPYTNKFSCAIAALENGYAALPAPSGLSAITTALMAFLNRGDHLLMVDTVYPPTRSFCNDVLARMGVSVDYYDPLIGADIERLMNDKTRAIYMESPGSATFEIQDVPVIVKVAKARGVVTLVDNSYASGVLFKPLDHGADVSLLSCTKYINGHSDAMLGAIVARDAEVFAILKRATDNLGVCAGVDEMEKGMRGLNTLHLRMKEAGERALKIAQWLEGRDEVARVYYPGLESDPNYALLKRDYKHANGLVSILLKPAERSSVKAFTDALELFPIGSSWGGYESLLQPQYPTKCRTAVAWDHEGQLLRFQVGLEDTDDLIADLEQAFEKFDF